jgi:ParB/RepB/Spo0J family partition protein
MTTNGTAMLTPTKAEFRMIGLDQVHESPWNPRKHFDKAKLDELARSIASTGMLNPLTVRPRPSGSGYEIAAGHRRRRAALLVAQQKSAGVDTIDVPCLVRELSDKEFLEILVIENGQREDVHPLEEAQGYYELMREEIGYDVAKIAERAGRSKDFVYDRLKLLSLVPKAKDLFLEDRFTLQHAIVLARLSSEWQEKAIAVDDDEGFHGDRHFGLFRFDNAASDALDFQEEPEDPYDGVKPVSVREFQHWVDHTVRFDAAAPDVGDLFPETADAVTSAEEAELKVVHITHLYQTPEDARDEQSRTYTQRAWERADGKFDSKECEHSVLGLVVVGPGRGESFPVCIAKEKCTVHYADRIREKAKREKEASKNGGVSAAAKEKAARDRETDRYERERKREELERARWTKAAPAIADAVAEKVKSASLNVLADVLLEEINVSKRASALVPRGRSADDLLRYFAFGVLESSISNAYRAQDGKAVAKRMGVNWQKIMDEVVPVTQTAANGKGNGKR